MITPVGCNVTDASAPIVVASAELMGPMIPWGRLMVSVGAPQESVIGMIMN